MMWFCGVVVAYRIGVKNPIIAVVNVYECLQGFVKNRFLYLLNFNENKLNDIRQQLQLLKTQTLFIPVVSTSILSCSRTFIFLQNTNLANVVLIGISHKTFEIPTPSKFNTGLTVQLNIKGLVTHFHCHHSFQLSIN